MNVKMGRGEGKMTRSAKLAFDKQPMKITNMKMNLRGIPLQRGRIVNQHVSVVPIIFLTYQRQVWQFSQALAFVQHSLPLVANGV